MTLDYKLSKINKKNCVPEDLFTYYKPMN